MANQTAAQRPDRMTAEQAKTLKDLARNERDPEAYTPRLSQAGAETRINILRAKKNKDNSGAQHKPE